MALAVLCPELAPLRSLVKVVAALTSPLRLDRYGEFGLSPAVWGGCGEGRHRGELCPAAPAAPSAPAASPLEIF